MKSYLLSVLLLFTLAASSGCTRTAKGIQFGLPGYENRNIAVSEVDLSILEIADNLLSEESAWSRRSDRECEEGQPLSLFCALESASYKVLGKYEHRQAALQEVRFVIDDRFKNRWTKHRLADFNTHPDTTFFDVKTVLKVAIQTVEKKLLPK